MSHTMTLTNRVAVALTLGRLETLLGVPASPALVVNTIDMLESRAPHLSSGYIRETAILFQSGLTIREMDDLVDNVRADLHLITTALQTARLPINLDC